jgi:putative glutamine amidotransferase
MKIGITDCARYGNYERWFLDAPDKVDVIRLSYRLNNLDDIDKCQGVVLSGGEDVDPRRYKRPDLFGRIEFTDIDEKRDDFEMLVITRALQMKLPILSICRGQFSSYDLIVFSYRLNRYAIIQCLSWWNIDL